MAKKRKRHEKNSQVIYVASNGSALKRLEKVDVEISGDDDDNFEAFNEKNHRGSFVWLTRSTGFKTLMCDERNIGTIANCLVQIRAHAQVGDVVVILASTKLQGAQLRERVLFVGVISRKVPVESYHGSSGGPRSDCGVHVFPHASSIVNGKRKLTAEEAVWSGRGNTTTYHKPRNAAFDYEAQKLVQGRWVLCFDIYQNFGTPGVISEEVSRLAPPAIGCRKYKYADIKSVITPLLGLEVSGGAAEAADAPVAPPPLDDEAVSQFLLRRAEQFEQTKHPLRKRHVCTEYFDPQSTCTDPLCLYSHSQAEFKDQGESRTQRRMRKRRGVAARKRAAKAAEKKAVATAKGGGPAMN